MRVDDNLPGKKGQKSRQGRRPSTRAEGAGRAAIESPFHRCRHRRSPAISLSPSTTRAASFPIFCRPLRFPVSCFFYFGLLVDSVNRPKLRQQESPPSFHTHSVIHRRTALTRQTPSDQLYNWGSPNEEGKNNNNNNTRENPVSARGRKKKEHQHGRENERARVTSFHDGREH